jgi:hypothetical protein
MIESLKPTLQNAAVTHRHIATAKNEKKRKEKKRKENEGQLQGHYRFETQAKFINRKSKCLTQTAYSK